MNKSQRHLRPQMPSVHPMTTRSRSMSLASIKEEPKTPSMTQRSMSLTSIKEEPQTPSQDMGKSSADDMGMGTEEVLERLYIEQKSRMENSIRTLI